MNQLVKDRDVAAAGAREIMVTSATSSTATATVISSTATVQVPAGLGTESKAIENAVYGYLQAIRALNRTEVKASEIAEALSLPQDMVILALSSLRRKGVKPI